VLVVDDGSTDTSVTVADAVAADNRAFACCRGVPTVARGSRCGWGCWQRRGEVFGPSYDQQHGLHSAELRVVRDYLE
jgi:glycosyltransferase involved in cell wall biosynthesis